MARLPYVIPEKASAQVQETFAQLPTPLNVFKMMAHAETNFRPLLRLGSSILAQQKLSAKLRELAVLRVTSMSGCRYEWVQHVSIALLMGATRLQVDAIEKSDIHAECFDAVERRVLDFTTEVVRDARCSQPTFSSLRQHLSPREIVELLVAIGYYLMIGRLVETLEVEVEAPSEQVANQARKWRPS